jgi:hypothetical protein
MNNWTGVAVIIAGYAVGLYFQNKRIDDFKLYIDAKFEAVNLRLSAIEARLAKPEQQ